MFFSCFFFFKGAGVEGQGVGCGRVTMHACTHVRAPICASRKPFRLDKKKLYLHLHKNN